MIIVNGVDYYNVVVIQGMHRIWENMLCTATDRVLWGVKICDPTIINIITC